MPRRIYALLLLSEFLAVVEKDFLPLRRRIIGGKFAPPAGEVRHIKNSEKDAAYARSGKNAPISAAPQPEEGLRHHPGPAFAG
jgi:hypothetical protein